MKRNIEQKKSPAYLVKKKKKNTTEKVKKPSTSF